MRAVERNGRRRLVACRQTQTPHRLAEEEYRLSKTARGSSRGANTNGRVTLADIAAAAGVSVTTASNVVNGRLEMMSDATRARVEDALRVHKYRPDEGARSLRLAQKRLIGLLVIDELTTLPDRRDEYEYHRRFLELPQRQWHRTATGRAKARGA